MTSDSLSAFITSFRNAAAVGRERFSAPCNKSVLAVGELLVKHGFLRSVSKVGTAPLTRVEAVIAYQNGRAKLMGARRVSKPSRRVYEGAKNLRPIKNGRGMAVISTTAGVMTDKEARAAKLGGEVLFNIW